ncbi:uncharacterized protein LOC123470305 [Daphnia magna]|uniref:uncharacterized protein LOC123470305 n=1 Tax=Daphnia magna TaxID=35525 RepID=UPI001E1BD617|nr:uncharacterized protein LOC123470305 [Daphnia magna]
MFDDEKLLKCKNALLVYKFRTNSKFSGLNLPETPDDTQGYHSSCYSKFTAVSSSQIKLAKEKQCNKNSESASAVQDSSSVPDAETACATQSNSNTPARNLRSGKQPNVSNTRTGVFLIAVFFVIKYERNIMGKMNVLQVARQKIFKSV